MPSSMPLTFPAIASAFYIALVMSTMIELVIPVSSVETIYNSMRGYQGLSVSPRR